MSLDLRARGLNQLVVLDAGGAGGHARHTPEAGVDVAGEPVVERRPALETEAHQIDAPPRGIGLLPPERVRGAGREAKPAVDAVRDVVFRRRVVRVEHTRQRHAGVRLMTVLPIRRLLGSASAQLSVVCPTLSRKCGTVLAAYRWRPRVGQIDSRRPRGLESPPWTLRRMPFEFIRPVDLRCCSGSRLMCHRRVPVRPLCPRPRSG